MSILPLAMRNALFATPGVRLPYGPIGVWLMSNYTTSPRAYVPNTSALGVTAGAPVNILNVSRRLFAASGIYGGSSFTVTDEAVSGPVASTLAATLVCTGSWYFGRAIYLNAAGTYTFAVSVKRNTGTDQTFKLVTDATTSAAKTATSSWQRFTQTFTVAAAGTVTLQLFHNGVDANLQIDNFELYAGSSDLGPETNHAGHLSLGAGGVPTNVSYSGGNLNMTAAGSYGYMQFPSTLDLSTGITVLSFARKTGAGTGYMTAMAKPPNQFTVFNASLEQANGRNFVYTNAASLKGVVPAGAWNFLSNGWHIFGHRYDPVAAAISMTLDGGIMTGNAGAYAAPTLRDLIFSSMQLGGAYGEGWEWAGMALWNRALSDAEILTAERYMQAYVSGNGIYKAPMRFLLSEGDSLSQYTTGNYTVVAAVSSFNPTNIQLITAAGGSTLDSGATKLTDRTPFNLQLKPTTPVVGSKYIISLMMTNGATDSTYITALHAACQTYKNAGWLVALGTLPYRVNRNPSTWNNAVDVINTDIRSLAGGSLCDVVYDIAALNLDPSNTTYFVDGVHLTDAGNLLLVPVYAAAINSL